MPNYWFTADTHFFHRNMIKLSGRPFTDLFDMHEQLVARWNSCVRPGDIVYHLGDFALSRSADREDISVLYRRLNGEKFLVRGNHDMKNEIIKHLPWRWQGGMRLIAVNGQQIFVCHYAMQTWDRSHYGSWNLHGHSHGNLTSDPNALKMDVGVDTHDFYPYSFDEIAALMKKKNFTPIEKHRRTT